jgi:hypothetical protein
MHESVETSEGFIGFACDSSKWILLQDGCSCHENEFLAMCDDFQRAQMITEVEAATR